jgi:hypothetical protein
MRNKIESLGVWAINTVGMLACLFIIALPVMFLWNRLEIFPTINYSQAFVLVVLGRLLTQPFNLEHKNAKTLD